MDSLFSKSTELSSTSEKVLTCNAVLSEETVDGEEKPFEALPSDIFQQAKVNQQEGWRVVQLLKNALRGSVYNKSDKELAQNTTGISENIDSYGMEGEDFNEIDRSSDHLDSETEKEKKSKNKAIAGKAKSLDRQNEEQNLKPPKSSSASDLESKESSPRATPSLKKHTTVQESLKSSHFQIQSNSSFVFPVSSTSTVGNPMPAERKPKEENKTKLRSALKSSPSQFDASIKYDTSSLSILEELETGELEKKDRRVTILAGIESLEELSTVISSLEREKKLKTIRRLEEVAKMKRQELAEVRKKMRTSLEEEIEINKQLEKVIGKMKILRLAGQEAAKLMSSESQLSTRVKVKPKTKKTKTKN